MSPDKKKINTSGHTELHLLKQKIIEKIEGSPRKASRILSEWMKKRPVKKVA